MFSPLSKNKQQSGQGVLGNVSMQDSSIRRYPASSSQVGSGGFFDDALGLFGLFGNAVNPFAAGAARSYLAGKQAIKDPISAVKMLPINSIKKGVTG